MGIVSDELLEQFNNPDTFEHIDFSGTADIILDVDMSYRLVWEASDGDERGWYTVGSGPEYSFVVTPEIMDRGYRVVLFAVD